MLKDSICGFCCERHDCFILGNGYCGKRERLTAKILTAVRECKLKEPVVQSVNEHYRAKAHNAAIDKVLAKLEGK